MYSINDIQVFIPTYNRPNFLDESLNSLVKQTAGVPEIIVFNNGNMSETSDVINKYAKYGVREVKSSGGLLECMDNSEKYLRKKYVMFFHDDDILNCKYLEYSITALNSYSNIAFITSSHMDFRTGESIDISPAKEEHYLFSDQCKFSQYMYLNEHIAMQTTLYNVELFKKHKRDFKKYGKFFDWPYLVKLSAFGNTVLFSDKKIFYVRRHAEQWTNDEKSSWTVSQLINWHHSFYTAIHAYDDNKLGYYIFYSKFRYFISGGYMGLVCQKYKEQIPYNDMITMAKNIIGIDSNDPVYDQMELIPTLTMYINQLYKINKFGEKIDNEIPVIKFLILMLLKKDNNVVIEPICRRNKKIENIFSVKNDKTGKYRVITIMCKKFFVKRGSF